MGGSGTGDDFAEAMEDVDRLVEGPSRVRWRRKRVRQHVEEPGVAFEMAEWGEHQQGRASKTDPLQLRRLELGDYPPELTLDLHGLIEDEAGRIVAEGLRRALKAGMRCVRVVHGRGLRSPDGPVLKKALPGWLARPPHGRKIMAFTTTGQHGAGGGATLVLLRP